MKKKSLFFLMGLLLASCSTHSPIGRSGAELEFSGMSPIVLMSDFGNQDDGIGICKGAMLKIQPGLTFVDITHQIPAFSVKDAARFLANATPHFPKGTVFLVFVEKNGPKLNRPIVAKSRRGQYFVLSDNGALTLVAERDGIEKVKEIQAGDWVKSDSLGSTFIGRDVYSPVAAHLARGEDWERIGPDMKELKLLDTRTLKMTENQLLGEVIALDGPFGNLITDITGAAFLNTRYVLGEKVQVVIGKKSFWLPFVKTFSDVPVNESLIYIDSNDRVSVAINEGNFAQRYKVSVPTKFVVIFKKEK